MKIALVIVTADCQTVLLSLDGDKPQFPIIEVEQEPTTPETVVQLIESATGVEVAAQWLDSDGSYVSDVDRVYTAAALKQQPPSFKGEWTPLDTLLTGDNPSIAVAGCNPTELQSFVTKFKSERLPAIPLHLLRYNPSTWVGVRPSSVLEIHCQSRELPAPVYYMLWKRDPDVAKDHKKVIVTCVLPHLGLHITPDEYRDNPHVAQQQAALYAILYLEGGLTADSPFCRIVPVGYHPLSKPGELWPVSGVRKGWPFNANAQTATPAAAAAAAAPAAKDAHPAAGAVGGQPPNSNKQKEKPEGEQGLDNKKRKVDKPIDVTKHPASVLNELCHREQWPLWVFRTSRVELGVGHVGHVCTMDIPQLGVKDLSSEAMPSAKLAKSSLAAVAVQMLIDGGKLP